MHITGRSAQQTDTELGLPQVVREAYEINEDATLTRLSGGLVNDALVVDEGSQRTIMRRLSPILSTLVLEDTQAVALHLAANGWDAPSSLPTAAGSIHIEDEGGNIWHRMQFITSDGKTPEHLGEELSRTAGTMLGAWHTTVQALNYVPRFSFDHFHDTSFIAAKITRQLDAMPDKETHSLARKMLGCYSALPLTEQEPTQLIHGDPKLDNILFRNGNPYTLIDFDNVMLGSRWLDVGDFLRSLTGKLIQQGTTNNETEAFAENYHEAGELTISVDETTARSYQATSQIALELGMRYLSDIVDTEKYFSWDPSRHGSRRNNHVARAELQLQVAELALQSV